MERLPKELNEQIFQKLKSIVEIERMTPDERLEEGVEIGIKTVATRLKQLGMDLPSIVRATGLSEKEILAL